MIRSSLLILTLLSFGSVALAQAEDPDRAKAAALLDEGNQLFEAKKFDAALAKYEAAYAAFPSPKILFNIAEAKRELGRNVEAANAYAAFIDEATIDPASEIGTAAREELEKLDREVARLTFEGDLEDAAISVDGDLIEHMVKRELRVEPGQHRIRATRGSLKPFDKTLTARQGTATPVSIELSETPPINTDAVAQSDVTRVEKPREDDKSITSEWWFWTAIGSAAAVAILVTAVAASSGGDDRLPMGELPASSTADWMRF